MAKALLIILLLVAPAQADWGYAIVEMSGGLPKIDQTATPYHGYALIGTIGNYGAYIISGTQAQLIALNATPEVYGICLMTASGDVKWAELDNVITPALRTKLNTWLTAHGKSTIPVNWTNRQVAVAVLKYMKADFKIGDEWIKDQ